MGTVKQAVALQDLMTPSLRLINSTVQTALQSMNNFETGLDDVSSSSQVASKQITLHEQATEKMLEVYSKMPAYMEEWQDSIKQASIALRGIGEQSENTGDKANKAGRKMQDAFGGAKNVLSSFPGIITAVNQGLQLTQTIIGALQKPISIADNFIDAASRLNVLNDGLRTTEELQRQIQRVSQLTRTSYQDMMDVFSQIGFAAGDVFEDNNDYMLRFSELMTKALSIGGTKGAAATSVLTQLSQALGRGVLQGQELNSVMTSPIVSSAIADYLGVGIGKLKELGSEGKITSGAIVAAMFQAGQEIDATFESMPDTFGDIMQRLKDTALFEAKPIIDMFSAGINSESFQNSIEAAILKIQQFIAWITNLIEKIGTVSTTPGFQHMAASIGKSLNNIIGVIGWLVETIFMIGGAVAQNWSIIEPILTIVSSVIGGIIAATLVYNTVQGVMNILNLISSIAILAKAKAHDAEAVASAKATAAQWGLNAALLASPVTWIILAIIVLIGIIFAVINAINKAKGTSISAIGVITGAIAVAGAFIWNTIVGVINAVIQFLWTMFVEQFIGIIEWVLNAANGGFNDFGGAVANLVGNIISWFLSLGKIVTKIIDAIFGTNWTGGLSSLQEKVLSWGKNENAITLSREAPTINHRFEYGEAWNAGYSLGEGIDEKMSDMMPNIDEFMGNQDGYLSNLDDYMNRLDNGVKAEVTGGKLDSVGIADEDLKYLRDIAEIEYINKHTTTRQNVNVNFGDVHETADVNEVLKVLEELAAGKYDNVLVEG